MRDGLYADGSSSNILPLYVLYALFVEDGRDAQGQTSSSRPSKSSGAMLCIDKIVDIERVFLQNSC